MEACPSLLSCANTELKGAGSCKPDRPSDLLPPILVPTQQASTGVPLTVAGQAKLLETGEASLSHCGPFELLQSLASLVQQVG